jgi:hypothetical protein
MLDDVVPGDLIGGLLPTGFAIFVSPFLPPAPNRGPLGGNIVGRSMRECDVVMSVIARVPNDRVWLGRDLPQRQLYVYVMKGLAEGTPYGWIPIDHVVGLGVQKLAV